MLRLGAHGEAEGPHPVQGGGQYYLVIGGSLLHAGAELPKWSCLFLSAGEAQPLLRAGAMGLEALVLQYPRQR